MNTALIVISVVPICAVVWSVIYGWDARAENAQVTGIAFGIGTASWFLWVSAAIIFLLWKQAL